IYLILSTNILSKASPYYHTEHATTILSDETDALLGYEIISQKPDDYIMIVSGPTTYKNRINRGGLFRTLPTTDGKSSSKSYEDSTKRWKPPKPYIRYLYGSALISFGSKHMIVCGAYESMIDHNDYSCSILDKTAYDRPPFDVFDPKYVGSTAFSLLGKIR
ncbi:hypothetical protein MXB_2694, partial [Myxobolus squamalis]